MALKFDYNKQTRRATVCGVDDMFCEQIVIPSTVEYYRKKYDVVAIKYEAFKECIKLKSVTIPDSVTSIGYWAFYGCSSLKEFKGEFAADNGRCLIKGGVLIAYARASGTTYAIPDSVTKIEMTAFSGCSSLTSVTIPDSVTEIGWSAFSGCSSLTSITIPDSVTWIGVHAFIDCSSLKEFKGKFAADNGRCLIKGGVLIAYASASGTTYAIPNSVTEIGLCAFEGCSSLTSVTITNGVTKIGEYAFKGCSSLTSITIPDGVTVIGWYAFSGCSSLTSVTIPDSVTEIELCAFEGCSSLTSVTIPNSVTKIGNYAFRGCGSLKNVEICNEQGSVKIDSGAFGSDVKVTYLGKDAKLKK